MDSAVISFFNQRAEVWDKAFAEKMLKRAKAQVGERNIIEEFLNFYSRRRD